MNPHIWTPDSGTTELPSLRRGWPVEHQHTEEMPFWHPRPSVPTLVVRPSRLPRLRKFLTGLAVCAGLLALSTVPAPAVDAPTSAVSR